MSQETPGFNLDKMQIPLDERQNLSPEELRLTSERAVFNREMLNRADNVDEFGPQGLTNEIRDNAMRENLHRAQVDNEIERTKTAGYSELSPTEKTALEAAQKRLEDAWKLIEEGK